MSAAVGSSAGEMSATRKMTAAGNRVPTAAEVTATAPTRVPTAAVGLRPHGRCTDQQRTQNAGCQNKALGTHDCHLPLQAAPGAPFLKPKLLRPN
jgi:hypothetical protein